MSAQVHTATIDQRLLTNLNVRWHEPALLTFGAVVALHWVEHIVQAVQIWAFGLARPDAMGFLGEVWPALVRSEALHYGFAIIMLVAFAALQPGFKAEARIWWIAAFALQFWHHLEHAMLLYQAQTGVAFFGQEVPTSFIQLLVPRVELHLFYNTIVTIPMLVAMYYHRYPTRGAQDEQSRACSCARR